MPSDIEDVATDPRPAQDETSFGQMILWLVVMLLLIVIPVVVIVMMYAPRLD